MDEVFRYFSTKEDSEKTFERKFCKQTWSTDDRSRFIKYLAKCPKAPAELKTAMEYRIAEISTAKLKRKLAAISNAGDVPSSVVVELDASEQASSASVRSLSTESNLPRLYRIYSYFEWITDTSMDALKGVSENSQLSVRSILATRWEKNSNCSDATSGCP
ncbi:uncharacterized protein V1513DRAFT_426948 [Lipomyces chichibuensis]|uniref:uncharacterized protein n=1 Tax=Lipomyces chichibuensis TaxID=1546026 RepID=UPI0033433280